MTGYWDAYKLDIPMQWHMAMAHGNGNGDSDGVDEQQASATIDATESIRG
jgi:hypothetical protein